MNSPIVKIHTSSELYDILVDYNLDNPFEAIDKLDKSIKYFRNSLHNCDHKSTNYFFCLYVNGEIVGIVKYKVGGCYSFMYPEYNNWISYVSINPKHQSKGYSKLLLDELFKFTQERNLSILSSGYTKKGYNRIRPYMRKLAEKYNIDFKDSDRIEF